MRQFSQEELVEKIRSERCHIGELYDEINTLKRENANLKDYVKSLKDECISCPENKKNIKQAQIDILKKAKEKFGAISRELGNDYDLCGVSAVCSCSCEIDNLIKELDK